MLMVSVKPGSDATWVQGQLAAHGLWVQRLDGDGGSVHFVALPCSRAVAREELLAIPGVAQVATGRSPHPRVDARCGEAGRVRVGAVEVGPGAAPVIIAGPCSVESELHIQAQAARLSALGVGFLRGGAFKPRSSPYAFQGHGERALGWLRAAADRHGMQVVTEVLAPEDTELVAAHSDLLQIGSRTMGATALLKRVAQAGKPVLLKRGMAATVEEWLLAGEYLLAGGTPGVIFCERGVRGFDPSTRNLLDLGAVALLARVHRLPVIVDPSHAAGRRDLIAPLARAALAAGAAGLIIETHDDAAHALSDGPQALPPREMEALMREVSHAV